MQDEGWVVTRPSTATSRRLAEPEWARSKSVAPRPDPPTLQLQGIPAQSVSKLGFGSRFPSAAAAAGRARAAQAVMIARALPRTAPRTLRMPGAGVKA